MLPIRSRDTEQMLKTNRPAGTLLILLIIAVLYLAWLSNSPLSLPHTATTTATMTLVHTVLFQFKADANPEHVKAACASFLGLKEQCVHPTSKDAYIISIKGGQDNSSEGKQVSRLTPERRLTVAMC